MSDDGFDFEALARRTIVSVEYFAASSGLGERLVFVLDDGHRFAVVATWLGVLNFGDARWLGG